MGSNPIDTLGTKLSKSAETANYRLHFPNALLGIGTDMPIHEVKFMDMSALQPENGSFSSKSKKKPPLPLMTKVVFGAP